MKDGHEINPIYQQGSGYASSTAKPPVAGSATCSADSLNDQPWPLRDVVRKLCDAAEILLHEKNYDGHGHEEISHALKVGREWSSPPNGPDQGRRTDDFMKPKPSRKTKSARRRSAQPDCSPATCSFWQGDCGYKAVAEIKDIRGRWKLVCGQHLAALKRRKPPSLCPEWRMLEND